MMGLRFIYSPLPMILVSPMRNVISYLMEERDRTRVTVLYLDQEGDCEECSSNSSRCLAVKRK